MKQVVPLYLASQSRMRRELLTLSEIPFTLISQSADESLCDWNQEPLTVARSIALSKMNSVIMPLTSVSECLVLTADTICVDMQGTIHGKPKNHQDALMMLTRWREGCKVITAFCLDKKQRLTEEWRTVERIEEAVSTLIEFSISDDWIDDYLSRTPSYDVAGAMAIEQYGLQFVKTINGSYSNIMGLPLFEVRAALTKLTLLSTKN